MKFYQLAFRYISRKKTKTLLLLLVFVLVNTMILSTSMILRATEGSMDTMRAKTNSKVVAEASGAGDMITGADVNQIEKLQNISSVNRIGQYDILLSGLMPVTGSSSTDDDNSKAALLSYDDLENDSPFSELQYKLTAGDYIKKGSKGAVIHISLARQNGLEIGDMLKLDTGDGHTVSVPVTGFFRSSGNIEDKQPSETTAVNRVENQIFIDNETCSELFGDPGFYKLVIYTDDPGNLDALASGVRKISGNDIDVTTSDTLYRQMSAPLEQISRSAGLMLVFALLAGTLVVSLLLAMWMRTRQKEMAVLMSLGRTKAELALQAFCESGTVFLLSVFASALTACSIQNILQRMIAAPEISDTDLTVFLGMSDIGFLAGAGSILVLIALCISLFPVLRANPKDILAKTEG